MNEGPRRIRAIRKALNFSQDEFARIFTSQKRRGRPLASRAIGHWETGKAAPSTQQLEELLDFLEDADPYLRADGRDFSPWTALRYLAWYDSESSGVNESQAGFPLLKPRDVLGRRESLKDLVYGILDQRESPEAWNLRLQRCSRFASKVPFKEIVFLKRLARDGAELSSDAQEQLLSRDIERHGHCVYALFLGGTSKRDGFDKFALETVDGYPSEMLGYKLRDLHRPWSPKLEEEVSKILLQMGLDDEKRSVYEWLNERAFEEVRAFNLGVAAATTAVLGYQSGDREEFLEELEASSHSLNSRAWVLGTRDTAARGLRMGVVEMKARNEEATGLASLAAGWLRQAKTPPVEDAPKGDGFDEEA